MNLLSAINDYCKKLKGRKIKAHTSPFPFNQSGLKRGTILVSTHVATNSIGVKVGKKIIIGFNGQYICCQGASWDIQQLEEEIKQGLWKIDGEVDLSDPMDSLSFARKIEEIKNI